jgi:hypothetical protein
MKRLVVAAAVLALTCPALARADTSATVKADSTQRMKGPNLNSGQDGVYRAGQVLTLVCHSTGEAVKGYFSFNMPKGGWDSLWYKTSDGDYVADVDIETHTLNALGPECGTQTGGGTPPAPSSDDRASRALAWARNQMATNPNSDIQCIQFVQQAYNTVYPGNAIDVFNRFRSENKIQTSSDNIPAGALVFTSDPTFDHGLGHVMLSEGNGRFLTANYYVDPKIREVPLNSNDPNDKFLGWAYAP